MKSTLCIFIALCILFTTVACSRNSTLNSTPEDEEAPDFELSAPIVNDDPINDETLNNVVLTASMSITPLDHVFPESQIGYGDQSSSTFTITNTGDVRLWNSGDHNFGRFEVLPEVIPDFLEPGQTLVLDVRPASGLKVGTHEEKYTYSFIPAATFEAFQEIYSSSPNIKVYIAEYLGIDPNETDMWDRDELKDFLIVHGNSFFRHTVGINYNNALENYQESAGIISASTVITFTVIRGENDPIWTSVSAGDEYTIASRIDGTLWVWGNNNEGQLGDTIIPLISDTSVQLCINTNWDVAVAGTRHVAALKDNGSLWTWGDNFAGQLGNGTTYMSYVPVQVGRERDWVSITADGFNTFALKSDGSLWGWGDNKKGQLGDGTTSNRSLPARIGSDHDWVMVKTSGSTTFALKSDGSLWAWGDNHVGQLGDGTTVDRFLPTKVGTDNDWKIVEVSDFFTVAIKEDGSLWSWGYNGFGQLGLGTNRDREIPTRVGTDYNWTAVSLSGGVALAIKDDGELWAWGANYNGQLGDTSLPMRQLKPARIGTDSDWYSISAGGFHVVALKTDDTVWTWGNNFTGQLGDNTAEIRGYPAQIEINSNIN